MDNCIKASDKAPDEETLRGQNLIVRRQLLDDCIEASDKAPDDKITTETPITGAEDSCLSCIKDQIPNAKIAEHKARRGRRWERPVADRRRWKSTGPTLINPHARSNQ